MCAALILWRGLVVFSHRVGDGFVVDAADTALGMRMLIFVSFTLQISFISVVIGKDLRRRRIKERQAARQAEINRSIVEAQQEIEMLANERLDMLSLLTHEVRQPINNAQAALEALDHEVRQNGDSGSETLGAVVRAQTVLDEITLSISNAILGVSLVEGSHSIRTSSVEVTQIAELARSDCPADQRHRIRIQTGANLIFADMDPVLMRLALRNLFDNAIKYSVPNSALVLDIAHDERRLGVSFKVTNLVREGTALKADIFDHRVRGDSAGIEGSGHGLFLVKKVADAHHGGIDFDADEDGRVTFDLFIPD